MEINEFIDKLSKETESKYIITYIEEKKWYILTLHNPFIVESVIVTKRVLRSCDTTYKRIDLIKELMESKEKFFNLKMKRLMED